MKFWSDPTKDAAYEEAYPVSIFDVAAIETWLEDSARAGYRLVGFRRGKGHFDRVGAQTCRYRLKPLLKKEKAPDPAWVETYRELGWEYVGTLKGVYHIWRSDDPAAPELDTDPVVQGEDFRYLKRCMVQQVALHLLLILAMMGLLAWSWLSSSMPMWTALERGVPFQMPVFCVLPAAALILECLEIRRMRRLIHDLRTGVPMERPRAYRRPWQKRAIAALVVLWGCAVCGIQLLGTSGYSPIYAWPVADASDPNIVYVDLRALDGVPEDSVGYGSVKTKIHELAPRMYWTWQGADLPDGTGLVAYTSYYHLLLPALAPVLEQDLLEYGIRTGMSRLDVETPMEAQEPGELDSFWWRSAGGWQTVLAVRGRNVLYVRYEGPTDLRTAGDYFAALLKEG